MQAPCGTLTSGTRSIGLTDLPTCAGDPPTYAQLWWGGDASSDSFEWSMVSPAATSYKFPQLDPTLAATFWPSAIVVSWGMIELLVDSRGNYDPYRSTGLNGDSIVPRNIVGGGSGDTTACYLAVNLTP